MGLLSRLTRMARSARSFERTARSSTGCPSETKLGAGRGSCCGSDSFPTAIREALHVRRSKDPSDRGGPRSPLPESPYDASVRFEVLGPLRALAPVGAGIGAPAGRERSLGGPKQRLVLALLLAEPNTTVSVERLIDGVWGEAPPGSARHTLQSYVSELRKSVGDVIERDGTGYAIRVDRDRWTRWSSNPVSAPRARDTVMTRERWLSSWRRRSRCGAVRRSRTSPTRPRCRSTRRVSTRSGWPRSKPH